MTPEAAEALSTIRDCLKNDRFIVTTHFGDRMEQRGLMWPDVQAIIDDPSDVRDDGIDKIGRPKWAVVGDAADGLPVEMICAIDYGSDAATILITIYWED